MSNPHFSRMAEHFPDFDQSTLPPIPSDWVDHSWVNDTSPSFWNGARDKQVFIEHLDPALREFDEVKRFLIVLIDGEGDLRGEAGYIETDDWSAVLEWAC